MAGYRLLIKPSPAKEIEALGEKKDRERIVKRIAALASEPQPAVCEKLAGPEQRYRIRRGQFRIVYAIDDAVRTVEVVKVGTVARNIRRMAGWANYSRRIYLRLWMRSMRLHAHED